MTVYVVVVVNGSYEECSAILGVYSSIELAKASVPGARWDETPAQLFFRMWGCVPSAFGPEGNNDNLLIEEHEVDA